MKTFIRRLTALSALALATALPVHAQSSSWSFISEPGDYIGQGQSYSFTGVSSQASSDGRTIGVSITAGDHWWYLNFAAPEGQQLTPGVYEGAVRYPFQASNQPGLSHYGNGRGCNTLTGRFEVIEAKFGPSGYIERFHANYEQHCEGMTPALFGEISISNPPPPPPLTVGLALSDKGSITRANGQVTVGGMVTCSAPTTATVSGTVSQRANRFSIAQGSFSATVSCGPTPTRWVGVVSSYNMPFNQGPAQLDATAGAWDPDTGARITDAQSGVVNLITIKKN